MCTLYMHFRNLLPYFCGIGSYVKMLCAVIENDLILDVCVHFWNPLPFFGIGKYVKMLCAVIEN